MVLSTGSANTIEHLKRKILSLENSVNNLIDYETSAEILGIGSSNEKQYKLIPVGENKITAPSNVGYDTLIHVPPDEIEDDVHNWLLPNDFSPTDNYEFYVTKYAIDFFSSALNTVKVRLIKFQRNIDSSLRSVMSNDDGDYASYQEFTVNEAVDVNEFGTNLGVVITFENPEDEEEFMTIGDVILFGYWREK